MICKMNVPAIRRCLLIALAIVVLTATSASAEGLFPSMNQMFGTAMPSIGVALGRAADETSEEAEGKHEVYRAFSYDDYTAFGAYLAGAGATLEDTAVTDSAITATVSVHGATMQFTYNWQTKTATAVYPSGTRPETEKASVETKASILPSVGGIDLPSMSQALSRVPDATETLDDGSRSETYNNFDEADYTKFSQYLQTAGCAVDDYHVENGSVMVIQLSNLTGTFTFTYDTLRHIGKVVYPKGSRVEAAWAAPTATPKPAATATPKPSQTNYSQSECWSAAERYFKNLSWKNPSSVTIHSHSATYDSSDNTYTFYIDYSAQNGFGGYNRSYYFITVSAVTGRVTSAFGGN